MGKRIMYLLLLLASLAGCNTTRHFERDTTERIDFSQSDIVSVIKMASYNQSIIDSVLSIRKITFRIYDTEKPPNENGICPLLMEGEVKDSAVSIHNAETDGMDSLSVNDSTLTAIKVDIEEHIRKDIEVRTGIANIGCLAVFLLSTIFTITILNKHND